MLSVFVRQRMVFTFIAVLFLLLAVATALLLPKRYEASVLLAPAAEPPDGNNLSTLASQFGDFSSLAGISLNTSGSKEEAIAILESRSLAREFITEENLMPNLFPNAWDSVQKEWLVEEDDQPTIWDAIILFEREVRKVSVRKTDGLIALSITWHDPETASNWANKLVSRANEKIRDAAIVEANKSIKYLEEQLEKTSAVELRQGIYRLVENNLNTVMLASVREEFAFKVLDEATAPDLDDFSFPNRLLIIVTGALAGLIMATFVIFIRNARLGCNEDEDVGNRDLQ
jgi:uncharacterized protein involved in exopolysaccharide biosynthesis